MTEIYRSFAYRQMRIAGPVVVVDVDVDEPVAQQIDDGIYLPRGVGMTYVEGHAEIRAFHDLRQLRCGPAQEERRGGHVLDSHDDSRIIRMLRYPPDSILRPCDRAVLQSRNRHRRQPRMDRHDLGIQLRRRVQDVERLLQGRLPQPVAHRGDVPVADRSMDLAFEAVPGEDVRDLPDMVRHRLVRLREDLPEPEMLRHGTGPAFRRKAAESRAGDPYHRSLTSSPSTVSGATRSMRDWRSSSSTDTSMPPRTGFLSAKEILPTVATCLFRRNLVRLSRIPLVITARVASRILCFLIWAEKRSRPGAVPTNPFSPSSSSASGNSERTASRTLSGSSLGLTGQNREMDVMMRGPLDAYINKNGRTQVINRRLP